ncbi:hypothetical protein ACQCX5_06040 [Propionibacteriaceae bacterium G57]|uniref:hypothetical protein n=1 Tax=Aestuariimicrobium sp. G57 TaxID=3418485 RepID=UPI003DA76994
MVSPKRGSPRRPATITAIVAVIVLAVVVTLYNLNRSTSSARPGDSSPTGCPGVSASAGTRVAEDYPGLVVWQSKTYLLSEAPAAPGEQLGSVTCNLVEINDRTGAGVPTPWPNGTSSVAKVGSPIHAQQGAAVICEVTVRIDGGWRLFRAQDC